MLQLLLLFQIVILNSLDLVKCPKTWSCQPHISCVLLVISSVVLAATIVFEIWNWDFTFWPSFQTIRLAHMKQLELVTWNKDQRNSEEFGQTPVSLNETSKHWRNQCRQKQFFGCHLPTLTQKAKTAGGLHIISTFCKIFCVKYRQRRALHLTSFVVLTSSAFLLIELMRVLTSERCTSQRTKYSRLCRLSLGLRHGRVSKWWIFASNVWNAVNE